MTWQRGKLRKYRRKRHCQSEEADTYRQKWKFLPRNKPIYSTYLLYNLHTERDTAVCTYVGSVREYPERTICTRWSTKSLTGEHEQAEGIEIVCQEEEETRTNKSRMFNC